MGIECIYLDIDGPLHPQSAASIVEHDGFIDIIGEGLFRWVPILEDILEPHPDIKIVVHSSWRKHYTLQELVGLLGEGLGSRIIGVTDSRGASRYENIMLDAIDRGIHEFIILDDDPREFPAYCNEWIRCTSHLGISEDAVQQSIRNFITPPIPPLPTFTMR